MTPRRGYFLSCFAGAAASSTVATLIAAKGCLGGLAGSSWPVTVTFLPPRSSRDLKAFLSLPGSSLKVSFPTLRRMVSYFSFLAPIY